MIKYGDFYTLFSAEEMNNIEHRINHRCDTEHRHIIHYIRDIKRTNPVICRILDDEGRDQAQN